jgi:hypothetical protein
MTLNQTVESQAVLERGADIRSAQDIVLNSVG